MAGGVSYGLVLNRYTKSVVRYRIPHSRKPPMRSTGRKKLFNKKTPRTVKKLTELINLFYETRDKSKSFYWVTLTTLQHQTGKSDKELWYALKKFIQHRGVSYICVAERQRDNTGLGCSIQSKDFKLESDLHFHLIVEQSYDFNIQKEVQTWVNYLGLNEKFKGTSNPTNTFNVRRVTNTETLALYIAKYVRKPCPSMQLVEYTWENEGKKYVSKKSGKSKTVEKLQPYSSLFECRTFSCSGDLSRRYRERFEHFCLTVDATVMPEIGHLLKPRPMKEKSDWFDLYHWDDRIWNYICRKPKKEIVVRTMNEVWQEIRDDLNRQLLETSCNDLTNFSLPFENCEVF